MNPEMRLATEQAFKHIMDTFTGTDGGVEFVMFKEFIHNFDARAAGGDKAAEELIQLLIRFNRMIIIANKGCGQ